MEVLLYDITVMSQYQRQGLGRQLVKALREQAADQGITTVWVPAHNEDTMRSTSIGPSAANPPR